MTELKPCPFCGGNNIERLDEFSIGCHDCHLVVKLWGWGFGLPREITDGWNRRADDDADLLALFNGWLDSERYNCDNSEND